jgi:hypothetical protein
MANKTIPQLPAAIALTGEEQIEGVQGGGSVKIAAKLIAALGGPTGPTGPASGPTGPTGPPGSGPTGPTGFGPTGPNGGIDLQIGGNTTGTTNLISTGTAVFAGGNNITLSQDGTNAITIIGGAGGGAGASFGVSTLGNTLGATGLTGSNLVLAGINNITLSQATNTAGATITISGQTQSAQTGISGLQISNTTYTSGTVTFQNANGISFGSSGANGVSASYTVPTVTNSSFSAGVSNVGNTSGNTGVQTGQLVFAGGNNITLSVSTAAGGNQTITVSGPNVGGAQTGISGIVVSNTTYTSGTVSFSNANGISFGSSAGQAITASYTVPVQSVQSYNLFASSQTYTSSSTTASLNSLYFVGQGGVLAGVSGQSVFLSGATGVTTAGANVGISITNNSAGESISITAAAQTNQSMGVYATGAQSTAQASSSTMDARSFSVSGAGIVSAGMSTTAAGGPLLVISATQSNQAFSAQGGSSAFQTLVFTNSNNVSFSNTAGSIWGSYALNVSATGGTSNAISGLTFKDSNGVSFGLSTGAGVGTITATVAAQSAQSYNLFASSQTYTSSSTTAVLNSLNFVGQGMVLAGVSGQSVFLSGATGTSGAGNVSVSATLNSAGMSISAVAPSTQAIYFTNQTIGQSSSSTGIDQTLSYGFSGAISAGWSNSSLLFSVPQTSSLVGTSGLTVSVNASTLSVYPIAASRLVWPPHQMTAISAFGNGSVSVQYIQVLEAVVASRLDALMAWSASSSATTNTAAVAMTVHAGVYTRANSTALSSVYGGSTQTTYTYASNTAGQTQLQSNAIRPISCPINVSLTQGEYWIAFCMSTSASSVGLSTTNLAQTFSVYGGNNMQSALNFNEVTVATNSTTNSVGGMGVYSAATASSLTSLGMANIVQTGASLSQANIVLMFRNY